MRHVNFIKNTHWDVFIWLYILFLEQRNFYFCTRLKFILTLSNIPKMKSQIHQQYNA